MAMPEPPRPPDAHPAAPGPPPPRSSSEAQGPPAGTPSPPSSTPRGPSARGTGPTDGVPLGGPLHPAAVGVWSFTQLGALAVVVLINPASLPIVLLVAAGMVAVNAVKWARFRWWVAEGTLVITQGLIQQERRVIPLERIQSVDVVRRISHRALGVQALQVEAIGGADTEGQLEALSPTVAAQTRAALLAGRDAARSGADPTAALAAAAADPSATPGQAARSDAAEEEPLASISPRELLLAGLTEANVTVLAATVGFGSQILGDRLDAIAERIPALVGSGVAIVATVGLILVAVLLLIVAQFVTYWQFRLTRTPDDLRVRRGLLEQRFDTVPLRRLQAIRIEENLPRRLFGFAAVKADVAGKPGSSAAGTDTLLPFGTAAQARELVATILQDERPTELTLTRMPTRARTRRHVRAGLLTVVATAGAVAWLGGWGWVLGAVLAPLAFGAAELAYRALGWSKVEGLAVTRAGWWTRRTAFVPEHRLQALERRATLLQRWRGLATLELQIARSPGFWQGPQWIDLDARDADRLGLVLADIMIVTSPAAQPQPRVTGSAERSRAGGALLP